MTDPTRFLATFAQALSVMSLYPEDHPSRERVVDVAFDELETLCAAELPLFSFLENEVVCGRQLLREMRGWEWGARLAEVGVARLEFVRRLTREEFSEFLIEVHARLTRTPLPSTDRRQMRDLGVRFGAVTLDIDEALTSGVRADGGGPGAENIVDEVDTLRWVHDEVTNGRAIPLLEAEAIVRSLSMAMHSDAGMLLPLLQLKEFDQYTTTHSLNVSVLAMALAESMALSPKEVRAMGVSGLLHDVGKTMIPLEVLTKGGKLSEDERRIMNAHPREGARIILRSHADLDLAAVVAYEHHIRLDGDGYPSVHYHRDCAFGSRLVHVCDVFDALRTKRPYRDAWPQEQTLTYLESRTESEFDPHLVQAFVTMMRKGAARIRRLDPDGHDISAAEG